MADHTNGVPAGPPPAPKRTLRARLLQARRELDPTTLEATARALAVHLLAVPEVDGAGCVAAYVSIGSEPGTGPLLEALHAGGREVLLPRLLPDGDLDWVRHDPAAGLRAGPRGLLEPEGDPLGTAGVTRADVVLVPGLAVGADGLRLGRGGGSYDRVLARLPRPTFTCVLLHRGELLDEVPAEPHDRPVEAAATADGVHRLRRRG